MEETILQAADYEYVLELRNIVKLFPGVRALDGVNLKIRPGTVHVIVGENGAGKSTMMNVINGSYVPEEGEVLFKGKKLGRRTIQESLDLGISMIYQELNPVGVMNVAENLFLGREPLVSKGMVDYKKMHEQTREILASMDVHFDTHQRLDSLAVAGQQLIEIAKAVSRSASLVIMDEPTSSIADKEVDILFEQVRRLKAGGASVIYITHKMNEVFQIADEITVIRDGKDIESGPASAFDIDRIVALMVGRAVNNLYPVNQTKPGEIVLEARNLTKRGKYHNVSFQLRRGEILGFSGLVGAGRSEVMRAVFGLEPADSGEIWLEGKRVDIRNTAQAFANGIGMVTEDRRGEGIVPGVSVKHNVTLSSLNHYMNGPIVSSKRETLAANEIVKSMSVRFASMDQQVRNLSGGNQQKVILSRLMLLPLKVLILDEPTRGIDIGAKQEIHQLMCGFAAKGYGIIMISSELPEILGMSDRIVVMHEGYVTGELTRAEADQEAVMKLAIADGSHKEAV